MMQWCGQSAAFLLGCQRCKPASALHHHHHHHHVTQSSHSINAINAMQARCIELLKLDVVHLFV
jgi:hypothetical protein